MNTFTLSVTNKTIFVSPIRFANIQGENNINKVTIPLPRTYGDIDLTALTFSVKGLYENGEEAIDSLTKTVTADAVKLDWTISKLFTAYAGDLALTIIGTDADNSPLIKFVGDKKIHIEKDPNGTNLNLDVVAALKTDVTTLKTETIAAAASAEEDATAAKVSELAAKESEEAAALTAEQIVTDEEARVAAEEGRVTSEQGRVTAEEGRVTAEEGRVTAETDRATAETARVAAELLRQAHITDKTNPHAVTKAQVGLANVDNTSDALKPVSAAQQTALDLKASKAQENWITPTLLNAWASATSFPVRYMKDTLGFVHMKGRLISGSLSAIAFTLPVGYRPPHIIKIAIGANGYGQVDIDSSGNVTPTYGTTTMINLDNVVFRAEG